MKTILMAVLLTSSVFAWDESVWQQQMRWQQQEQTRIMQEQLELQKEQLRDMQMEQNRIRGMQERARGGVDTSAIQNWLMNQ